jgi:hypothetical protein
MRYMLLMRGTQAEWRALDDLAPDDIRAQLEFRKDLDRQLEASGELVSELGLTGPAHAKVVRARTGGAPAITGAPFPETREFLAGYWVVDCDSPQRATEIAARVSASPGRAGAPLNLEVEVRQVMRALGEEM